MMKNKKKKKWKGENGGDSEVMLDVLENQVTEVKDTMRINIEKMHEREGKLEDLESRADVLSQQTTVEFKTLALKTRRKAEKKSRRLYFILGGIIAVAVILIIIILALYFTGNLGDS